jgi:hypothetical protein
MNENRVLRTAVARLIIPLSIAMGCAGPTQTASPGSVASTAINESQDTASNWPGGKPITLTGGGKLTPK